MRDRSNSAVGELYDVPVFLDAALAEDEEIVFGAGSLSDSVRMIPSILYRRHDQSR